MAYFVVEEHHGAAIHLVTAARGTSAGDNEVGLEPAMLFFRTFVLALCDCLIGADNCWTGSYGCDYTEHHDAKYLCDGIQRIDEKRASGGSCLSRTREQRTDFRKASFGLAINWSERLVV